MSCDNIGPIPRHDTEHTRVCQWCESIMTKEPLYEYVETDGQPYPAAWTWVYRCGTCGKVLCAMTAESEVAS